MLRLNYEKKDLGFSFALAVAVMAVASVVLSLIFGETSGWRFWLMQALYTLCIGGSAILYAVISKTNPIAAAKLNKVPPIAHIGWGCLVTACLIFAMMPVNSMLMDAIEATGLKRPSVSLENDVAGLVIVAGILPALCEELVFRGTVAQSLAANRNKWATLAICGGLFAIYHANPAQTVHQFVLGGFLALLALRSGSLWTSVAVHMFNNLFVIALSYTPLGADEFWSVKSNTGAVLGIMFAGIAACVLCIWGYVKTTKSVWHTNEQQGSSPQEKSSYAVLFVAAGVCLALWIAALFV